MPDNANENIEEYGLDEAELKKVEEMIKTSSYKKKKPTTNSSNGGSKSFIELCKNNILLPIVMVVALAAIVIGIIFFISPEETQINTIGITYETLVDNYTKTQIYQSLFKSFNTQLPEIELTDGNSKNLKYFGASIPNDFTTCALAIQGSVNKSNNEITAIRFMFEKPSDEPEDFSTTLFLYYEMIMNSLFPNLDATTIDSMLASTSKTQQFEVYENIAYRFSIQTVDGVSFYALDFASAADYQQFDNSNK